nr:hypothetical protein Iba_chr12eCG4510 [Ipomoea batatas]
MDLREVTPVTCGRSRARVLVTFSLAKATLELEGNIVHLFGLYLETCVEPLSVLGSMTAMAVWNEGGSHGCGHHPHWIWKTDGHCRSRSETAGAVRLIDLDLKLEVQIWNEGGPRSKRP